MPVRPRKPPTRVLIARHGQTESNRDGRFCGHAETALTDLGRAQAAALGRRLGEVPIAACYTSDFSRAVDTAAIALAGREITPRVDLHLREISYGAWELERERDIARSHPEEFARMRSEDPAWQPPGGETIAQVRARTHAALLRVAHRHRHETALVVAHGTAIQCMLAEVLGMRPEFTFRFAVANCALSEVTVLRGKPTVTLLNETLHLRGLQGEAADAPGKRQA
ncbi:MAG: histidine phosphatase family protein [Dehalococcoidia bacterium]|nr:histidine phosphatase family protein [Dehalococcoidia bacterium]